MVVVDVRDLAQIVPHDAACDIGCWGGERDALSLMLWMRNAGFGASITTQNWICERRCRMGKFVFGESVFSRQVMLQK